jgi:hypothetical protein
MNRGTIRRLGHDPTHGIDFSRQMPLANPAYRRVAGHLTKIIRTKGKQTHPSASPRRCARRLAPSVTTANDHNVEHGRAIQAVQTFINCPARSRFT